MLSDVELYPVGSVTSMKPGLMALNCDEACSSVKPCFRRPTTCSQKKSLRIVVSAAGAEVVKEQNGTAMSKPLPTSMPKKLRGVTPITSVGCPSIISLLPIAESCPPNSPCHNA